ncbi:hypothetical protein F5B19DRAFT_456734 [Rostrohypoxylon terebratum]|nr:hypothetical protein F5B19DRAFT_456734 [Rostrohypoxylon terebratum]
MMQVQSMVVIVPLTLVLAHFLAHYQFRRRKWDDGDSSYIVLHYSLHHDRHDQQLIFGIIITICICIIALIALYLRNKNLNNRLIG